ncbi:MAG TPA: SDR family oxidoreductase [Thermoleophilaceae bacterium]|jgi:nucleoside-diphosphate-sugar epimerase
MRVLVVGGTGFVGAEVVARLAAVGVDVVSLSRSGTAVAGEGVSGDARAPDMGLRGDALRDLLESVTHVVSSFGTVDWDSGPRIVELHEAGTRNVLDLAARMPNLERLVHVSSVLALGRAEGVVGNADLDVGQTFRSWYDYAKFTAERRVRLEESLPWRVLRLGPVLGVGAAGAPSAHAGILAALPPLVRGYPVHLTDRGAFPCYPTDAAAAAEVTRRALFEPGDHDAWTWFDPDSPTLGQVFVGLCAAWNVLPRIVEARAWGGASQLLARRFGAPDVLLSYSEPWVDLAPDVLEAIPGELPRCEPGYLEATSAALHARQSELVPA